MFQTTMYVTIKYDPTDFLCKVIKEGSGTCVITHDEVLFSGDYDEVNDWVKENLKEGASVFDGMRYEVRDLRSFRNDYIQRGN